MNVDRHIMRVGNQSQLFCQVKEFTVIKRPSAILDRASKSRETGVGRKHLERVALAVTEVSLFLDIFRTSFGNALALAGMIPVSSHGEVRMRCANRPLVLLAPPTRAHPNRTRERSSSRFETVVSTETHRIRTASGIVHINC